MGLPLDTLTPFSPINPVTPFTYRDNATYQTILSGLEDKLNELITDLNVESSNNAGGLNAFKAAMIASLTALRVELLTIIEEIGTDSLAFNPTTGSRVDGVSKVIGDVYDNNRVFAYFAGQYDDLALTAAEYDALNYSARHFDLGITYPVLNDVRES